jgi:rare lipoprotein A
MTRPLLIATLCCAFVAGAAGQATLANSDGTLLCSYYSSKYNGHRTASGQRFDNEKLTAASKTYPLGTRLRITNVENGKTAIVLVNDRGPFVADRDISVTRRAARQLGFLHTGVAHVTLEPVSK